MASIVQHTIKIKCYSGIKCTSQSQQTNLSNLQKKEDRLDKVYYSDGESGTFCDMEDLKYTQDCFECALPDVLPLILEIVSMVRKVMNLLQEEGTSQINNLVT